MGKQKPVKSFDRRRKKEWAEHKELGLKLKAEMSEMKRLHKKGDIHGAVKSMEKYAALTEQFNNNWQRLNKQDKNVFQFSYSRSKRRKK